MIVDMETRELAPDIISMALTGRLILGNRLTEVEHAIRQRIQQGQRKLVLDLSGLDFIDSAGIGVVAVCIGLMEREGGKLVIAGAAGQVKHLLDLTHLDLRVGIYPDVSLAHRALSVPTGPPQA
jgi:anti-sigma B factor antagonist